MIAASVAIACGMLFVFLPPRRRSRLDFSAAPVRKLEKVPPEMQGIWVGRRAQRVGEQVEV